MLIQLRGSPEAVRLLDKGSSTCRAPSCGADAKPVKKGLKTCVKDWVFF